MKKMNKKGFTLIELLAIIVILAIIAVITVPIILNIIDEAKKGAEKNSVIGYGKAVELAYTQYLFEESTGTTNNTHVVSQLASPDDGKGISITIDNAQSATLLKVDFDGDKVVCAEDSTHKNKITSGVVSLQNCTVNGGSTTYSYTGGKATSPSATTPAS
jgi:type IV pilus assembly protein PilA